MRILSVIIMLGVFLLASCQSITPGMTGAYGFQNMAPDESITSIVQSNLATSGIFDDVNIQVLSEEGMVTLSGFVKTIKQYDTAVKIASESQGVRGVRNHLVIRK